MRWLVLAGTLWAGVAGAECNLSNTFIMTFGAMPDGGTVRLGSLNADDPDHAQFRVRLRESITQAPAIDCECMIDFANEAHAFDTAHEWGFVTQGNAFDGGEECPSQYVVRTDSLGYATFNIPGYASASADGVGGIPTSVIRYRLSGGAWQTLLSVVTSAYDLNGSGGVNPSDLSIWQGDRNAYVANPSNYRQRSDFDGSGTITTADGAAILAVAGSSTTDQSWEACTGQQNAPTPAPRSSWGRIKATYR